jgi:hypothetical protein
MTLFPDSAAESNIDTSSALFVRVIAVLFAVTGLWTGCEATTFEAGFATNGVLLVLVGAEVL